MFSLTPWALHFAPCALRLVCYLFIAIWNLVLEIWCLLVIRDFIEACSSNRNRLSRIIFSPL